MLKPHLGVFSNSEPQNEKASKGKKAEGDLQTNDPVMPRLPDGTPLTSERVDQPETPPPITKTFALFGSSLFIIITL